jgi:hypothetical protein
VLTGDKTPPELPKISNWLDEAEGGTEGKLGMEEGAEGANASKAGGGAEVALWNGTWNGSLARVEEKGTAKGSWDDTALRVEEDPNGSLKGSAEEGFGFVGRPKGSVD